MAQFQFNARQYQPATADGGNPPLPVGEWPMQIVDSAIQETQSGGGGYIRFDVVIIDGEHKGHAGTWRLNLFNQNPQTVAIAQRQLSALCYAIGTYDITETSQFHGKPFIGVVKPNPSEKYPNGTQIGGVKDIQGRDPGRSPAPAQASAAPPAAMPQQAPQTPTGASNGAGWQGGSQVPAQAPTSAPVAWAPAAPPPPAAGTAPAWAPAPGAVNGAPPWAQK